MADEGNGYIYCAEVSTDEKSNLLESWSSNGGWHKVVESFKKPENGTTLYYALIPIDKFNWEGLPAMLDTASAHVQKLGVNSVLFEIAGFIARDSSNSGIWKWQADITFQTAYQRGASFAYIFDNTGKLIAEPK